MFEASYFSKTEHIIILILYILATTICLIGSVFVWTVVLSRRKLRSPMNYLLLNVSLSDIISSISVYPYLFILDPGRFSNSLKENSRLCIVSEGLTPFFIASAASLLTLCCISFNRFLAIKFPTKQSLRMNRRSVLIFSVISWLIGFSCMMPGMLSFKWDSRFRICARDWGPIHSLPYRLSIMLLGLVLPTTFLLLSYSAIYFKAREITPFEENHTTFGRRRTRIQKAERMLGVLIFIYILCWFPFIVYWAIYSVTNYFPQDTAIGTRRSQRWLRVTVLFCTLNGTINPFIYALGCNDLKQYMFRIARIIWYKLTCRAAFPVHPQALPYRSTLTRGKKTSTRNIAAINTIQEDVM